ncbi:MAG TPA: YqaJ viral recombinase family protein [Polyangia bacterium]|nr:YqaJ viral recombinase family protein [Polyangia bacterium]HUW17349.1 YqaJ viral recombinase family protein [Actinomycetes bacterium]
MKLDPASDPEVRRSGIGASDAAKIVGLSRFGDAIGLYMEKIGMTAPLVETGPMRWGKILEEPIAREYGAQTGRRVWRKPDTIRHPDTPFIYCHLDRLAKGKGEPTRVLEVKTAGVYGASEFGEPGTDQVPADYLLQVQHQLGVTGHTVGDLAVLIGGQKFVIFTIERDDRLIDDLFMAEARFWTDYVVPRIPPPMDGSAGASDYLAAKFRDEGITIEAPESLQSLAWEYRAALEMEKSATTSKAEIGNRIRSAMGDANIAVGGDVKITYREIKTTRTDWQGVVKASTIPPEVIAEYTAITSSQRLSVTVKEPA